MAISLKPLDQQVIVITGASSGIGLATALAAAEAGATLVLASRSEQTLGSIVDEINAAGGIPGPGAITFKSVIFACRCGDNDVGCDEQCDDGNNANGDGCDQACRNEP